MTMRQNTVRAVKGESTMRRAVEKFCRNKLAVIPFSPSIEATTAEVMKALEA